MKFRPRTTFESRSRCSPNLATTNIYSENKDIYQSPKIQSNKVRSNQIGKKLFSLLDVDDKKTNCRGTSVNSQYKRLSDEEIKKMYGVTYRVGWNYDKSLIEKFINRTLTSKPKYNLDNEILYDDKKKDRINNNNKNCDENNKKLNERKIEQSASQPSFKISERIKKKEEYKKSRVLRDINVNDNNYNLDNNVRSKISNNIVQTLDMANEKIKNYKINDNSKSKLQKNINSSIINSKSISEEINSKNIYLNSHNNTSNNLNNLIINDYKTKKINNKNINKHEIIKAIDKHPNRNDRWLPKNYLDYEILVKNPKLLEKNGKLPSLTLKEIVDKVHNSDIFFVHTPPYIEERKNINQKKNFSVKYTDSDIFYEKNNLINLLKCGENYLFKNTPQQKYTSSRESNSNWAPNQNNLPSLFNYQTTEYNILCPDKKISTKTKQTIIEECSKRNIEIKNNIVKNNINKKDLEFLNCGSFSYGIDPTHKQKAMGEFIDITRNGSGNPGKDFIQNYKNNKLCCNKKSDVCGTFGDMHLVYKNLCNKPFTFEKNSIF